MPQNGWTRADHQRLLDLLDAGRPWDAIAAGLGRSRKAVQVRYYRHVIPAYGRVPGLSLGAVARLLGVPEMRPARWVREGRLTAPAAVHARGKGMGQRAVSWESLHAFMRDPATWGEWSAEDVTDGALKAWARELRGGEKLLTLRDACRRVGYAHSQMWKYVNRGAIPSTVGVRPNGTKFYLLRESDVEAFAKRAA